MERFFYFAALRFIRRKRNAVKSDRALYWEKPSRVGNERDN
jgi:hypothetical protein